jgi:hypothetical protein
LRPRDAAPPSLTITTSYCCSIVMPPVVIQHAATVTRWWRECPSNAASKALV